jgi:micrococcal nuclease
MRNASLALLLTLGVAACSSPTPPDPTRAKVISVADGDTITVLARGDKKPERVRLYGIDCPERAQAYGRRAKDFTSDMVFGRHVEIVRMGAEKDRYGRTVAKVWIDKDELGQELLANGLAWHATRHDNSPHYASLEREARKERHGLWSDPAPVPPWKWRGAKRGAKRATKRGAKRASKRGTKPNPQASPSTGPLHGNVKSRVLHSQTCPSYDCKNCTEVFATTDAAKQQGFRLHDCVKE